MRVHSPSNAAVRTSASRHPAPRGKLVSVVAIAIVVVGAMAWLVARQFRDGRAPPTWNVLLVTVDTTRADRIGCYGYRDAETPTIDALSRDGIRYARCYSPVPLTLPSHCSLMTGLYPPRHGIRTNSQDALSADAETLAEILSRHGYRTGAVVGAFVLDRQFGLDQGFQSYDDDLSQGEPRKAIYFAERNAKLVTDAALSWWSKHEGGPRFLWVHYFDPHVPYAPPDFDPTFSRRRPYDAEIDFVDTHLERLLDRVDADARSDTLVVLTADHGEGLGQHGEMTHALFTYDSTLSVPLIVRFPDRRDAGEVVTTPVSLVDLMPSLLTWLGQPTPDDLDGIPLPLNSEESDAARSIYFENRLTEVAYGWSPLVGMVQGHTKLIQAPRPELYDLRDDPYEESDLYASDRDLARRMVERQHEFMARLRQLGRVRPKSVDVSAEGIARLRSLGYVGDTRDGHDQIDEIVVRGADPKDMVTVFQMTQQATLYVADQRYAEAADLLLDVLNDKDPGNLHAAGLLASFASADAALRPQIVDCLLVCTKPSGPSHDDTAVLAALGMALFEEQRFAEAAAILERLLTFEPDDPHTYRYLGEAYQRLQRRADADRCYLRAIELAETMDEPPDWLDFVREQIEP